MNNKSATCVVLDEQIEISLSDICHVCNCHAEWVVELVAEGILDPMGNDQKQWRFPGSSLQKAHTAMRLERDLGLNIAGVALALDLMEELAELRERLDRLEIDNTN
jgi:chaperone modulatory protein CbpM